MAKRQALGKGLGALIEGASKKENEIVGFISEIPIDKIKANPYQPRTEFDEEALLELAQSIKELGVIQPITVVKDKNEEGSYILVSGERRFRASKLAGLTKIPAYIKPAAEDQQMLEMALVENIQREDLDAISVAIGYNRLLEEYNLTQEELSKRVGKKRATIANYIRLLNLPAEIQMAVKNKLISMGHARALLSISDAEKQLEVFKKIIDEGISVRDVENIAKEIAEGEKSSTHEEKPQKKIKTKKEKEEFFKELQDSLTNFLGYDVKISQNKNGKGKLEISFKNEEELIKLMELFDKLKSV
jgi:ParB family chromosome partitioning protein